MQLLPWQTAIALLRDMLASPPLFPHPLLARLMERTLKAIIDVPPLATPTGVQVEARVIILGPPIEWVPAGG
jgi:hypothetical protein